MSELQKCSRCGAEPYFVGEDGERTWECRSSLRRGEYFRQSPECRTVEMCKHDNALAENELLKRFAQRLVRGIKNMALIAETANLDEMSWPDTWVKKQCQKILNGGSE